MTKDLQLEKRKKLQTDIKKYYGRLSAAIQDANTLYNKTKHIQPAKEPQQKGRIPSALGISSPVVIDPSQIKGETVKIKLRQDNQANAKGETKTFSTFSSGSPSDRSPTPTPSDSGILSDSQNTIQDVSQQQSIVKRKLPGGKKVSTPTVPTNFIIKHPVPSAVESPQTIGNTHSEKTPKEKWLSLIDKKCPREKLETNSYVEILKETIRNFRNKVKYTQCPVANFSDVEITSDDKKTLEEITKDFKEEIKRNEKILKKEEKRIKKFDQSGNSPPKSMFTKLLDLLHLSQGYTR